MGLAATAAAFGAVVLSGCIATVIARASWRIPLVFGLVDCTLVPCGLALTLVGLVRTFEAVGRVDPADKATILSAGIAEAMNCTAVGVAVGVPGLVVGGVLLYVAFSRRGRRRGATSSCPTAPAPASAAGS